MSSLFRYRIQLVEASARNVTHWIKSKGSVSIGIRILKGKTQTTGRSTVLLSLPSLDTCFLAFLTTAVVNRISKHRES